MKKFFPVFAVFLVIFLLCACGKKENEDITTTTTIFETPTENITQAPTENVGSLATEGVIVSNSESTTIKEAVATENTQSNDSQSPNNKEEAKNTTTQRETAAPTKKPTETEKNPVEKTGEMAFSDSKSNRYIKAVSQKYNVKAENLAALYTVPLNDSNIVLEFDGTRDASGKLIRNKDTLIAIYTIDKALNSKRASEDKKKNEYSYGEMKVIFISTTKYIMPEFQKELEG